VSSYKQHSPYLRTQNASCPEAFSGKKIEEKLPDTASQPYSLHQQAINKSPSLKHTPQ
jgi:hypothetical protein